ncbi:MAG: hypothetical protein QOI11_2017 [Candidatus Eremiobacteraeota bacterium]|nr:hypothetical protein [Candidatus Eremiobacteraeota bacterium]
MIALLAAALLAVTTPAPQAAAPRTSQAPAALAPQAVLAKYGAALKTLQEPRVFTVEYTLEQTGTRRLEQTHRIFRSGRSERDETIAVNGTRLTRPQVRVFRNRPYRYSVAALAPKPAQYAFAYAGPRKAARHVDYVFRLTPKKPGPFAFTELTVDGVTFLPGTVAFATRVHGGRGSVGFTKHDRWWVANRAGASVRAPGGAEEREQLTFSRWRFPPSLPPSTFALPRALPSTPPALP